MTDVPASQPGTTRPPVVLFKDRESPLLDIVRAYSSGEADWPTTKAALLTFKYVAVPATPDRTKDPEGWAKDYNGGGLLDGAPGTFGELTTAALTKMFDWERYMEVLTELSDKAAATPPPAK